MLVKTQSSGDSSLMPVGWKGVLGLGNPLTALSRVRLTLSTRARHSIPKYLLKKQSYMPVNHMKANLSSIFIPIAFYCNQQQLGK